MLDLQGLTIERVAVFNIPTDNEDKTPGVPTGGEALVGLPAGAQVMMTKRIAKALGQRSHGIEVAVTETEAGSFFQRCCECMDADDDGFLEGARALAVALARAQNNVHLSACKLVVMQGTVGDVARKYIAVVKAELQDALFERRNELQHLTEIFMTESQRLYKIGFVQRTVARARHPEGVYDTEQHEVHLFDHLMTSMETRSAAHYFYSGFMGCQTARSARSQTRAFYDQTSNFLHAADIESDRRVELLEALRTELRSNQGTLSFTNFGEDVMTVPEQREYFRHMRAKEFPDHAIEKDIEYVRNFLRRRRRILFSSGVQILTPPDAIDMVQVVTNDDGSSTVTIQGVEQSRQ